MLVALDIPPALIKGLLEGDIDLLSLCPCDKNGQPKELSTIEETRVRIAAASSIKEAFLALSAKIANEPIKADILVRAASPVSEAEAAKILEEAEHRRMQRKALTFEEIQNSYPEDPFYQTDNSAYRKAILRVYENLPRTSWNSPAARNAVESIVRMIQKDF